MPTVPRQDISNRGLDQIPEVRSVRARFSEGLGALAQGVEDFGESVSQGMKEMDRVKDVKAREEARDALTKYTTELNGVWGGSIDPVTGEQMPGIKHATGADAEGGTKRLAEWQRGWRDNPGGAYAALSPEAKKYFDPDAQAVYGRYGSLAVDHEFDQGQALKEKAKTAFLVSQEEMARQFHFDSERFAEVAPFAAHAMAVAKVGAGVLNPEEKDADKMRFKSEVFRAQYVAERSDAMAALSFDRAKTLLSASKTLADDGMAGERVGVAREIAKTLPPTEQAAVGELAAAAEGFRAAAKNKAADAQREADARFKTYIDSQVAAVTDDFHRGKFKTPAEADAALDKLADGGADRAKVTEAREHIGRIQKSAADAAELAANKSTFAKAGKGSTSDYLDFQAEVARGDAPWQTAERLNAAALSGSLEEDQYKALSELNRKGMDEHTKKAVTAVLAQLSRLDVDTVGSAVWSKDAGAVKARKKLMGAVKYEYDVPWQIDYGRKGFTAAEFDALVDNSIRFIQANPNKDIFTDYLKPIVDPEIAKQRALELAKQLSLNPKNVRLSRDVEFYRTLGGMAAKTAAERLATSGGYLNATQADQNDDRDRRVNKLMDEYQEKRKGTK